MQSFNLREEALVEDAPPGTEMAQGAQFDTGTVQVLRYTAEQVEIETESKSGALLVGSDTHHPGWRATVDGRAVPILLTDHAFRGIRLESGKHKVVMRYEPRGFAALLLASGLSWIGLIALLAKAKPE